MKVKEKLQKEKTRTQLYKLSQTAAVCILLLIVVEVLFLIPSINNIFDPERNIGKDVSIIAWVALWLLMFAQVTIIPIPQMPILVFCNKTKLVSYGTSIVDLFSGRTLFFTLFCASAALCGSMIAYLMGKSFGRKAVKWIAGEESEFDKWSNSFNSKTGKFIYGLTVLLPVFPDDLLCIVVGALKMDFIFFIIVHSICSVIGIFCSLLFMRLPYVERFFNGGDGFPWALLIYSILFIACIIVILLLKKKRPPEIV